MTRDIGIYQNYYRPELRSYLDRNFIPLDWTHNPYPEIREISLHQYFGQARRYREHHVSGVVSPKFFAKTKIDAARAIAWIEANPGFDLYLISGCPFMPYVSYNNVERGTLFHGAEFESTARSLYSRIGLDLPDVLGRQTVRNVAYAGYFFGTPEFWRTWTDEVVAPILQLERLDAEFARTAFSVTPYFSPTPVYLVSFLYERLISLFVAQRGIRALYYDWRPDDILALNHQPVLTEYLRRMIPAVDRIDASSGWTSDKRAWLQREYLAARSQYTGFDVLASAPDNFDRPALVASA